MKKFSVMVLLVVSVFFAACSVAEAPLSEDVSLSPSAYTSGLPAVQLLSAKVKMLGVMTSTYYCRFAGDIELENIAYAKEVKVVYNTGTGWKEAPAFYVKSLGNNREHWEFSIDLGTYTSTGDPRAGYSGPGVTVQFAIKYKVNGVTYWDNNGGYNQDYRITTAEGTGTKLYAPAALGKNKIVLTYATLTDYPTTYFRGTLAVKRLSGTPAISIVYTKDNWATTQVLNNNYKTGSYGDIDTYYFYDYQGQYNDQYEFALSYNIGGVTYWDNNVFVNYHVSSSQREPEY